MIDKNQIHVNYIKKEPQSGSYEGMRYLFRKGKFDLRAQEGGGNEGGDCMDVFIWPEPFCFVKTGESLKEMKQFPLTAEGRDEAVNWLNEQHELQKDRWKL